MTLRISPINWNKIEDQIDLDVWNKLTQQFWLDTKIPLSNDLRSWANMTPEEKDVTMKVFVGLTSLDTIQGVAGAPSLMKDAVTPHEAAVYANITFMEEVHAKSYSSIFSTLASTEQINDAYRWAEENEYIQYKSNLILDRYEASDPFKKKIASTLLESFLFFSGFFWPLYLSSKAKLTNTADIIRLIIADESVHGYYIGYKFQKAVSQLPQAEQDAYKEYAYELLLDLYDNEVNYTKDIYDNVGLTDQVKTYLKYNANKALQNLGYDQLFPSNQTEVNPVILSALNPNSGETHDFFSGAGSSYTVGVAEEMSDDDWE